MSIDTLLPRFRHSLAIGIDGNWHLDQKSKPSDGSDAAFVPGALYYADEKDFKEYEDLATSYEEVRQSEHDTYHILPFDSHPC